MTTIQLTDAQLAQFTACGIIVVDDDYGGLKMNAIQEPYYVAPELWRKLTDPCRRCGPPNVGQGCPDCAGGRQVVTLTATCPTYGETHIGNAMTFDKRGRKVPSGTGRCESDPPCERGVVTLGRFTIRLLPVIVSDQWVEGMDCVELNPYGECWLHCPLPPLAARGLMLDPLPQPGQWAVSLESVDSIAPK